MEDQSEMAEQPRVDQPSSEFFFCPKETKNGFEVQQVIEDYSIPYFHKELNKSDISEIKTDIGQHNIQDDRNYFCPPLLNDSIY